jgi:hypothetical protein
LEEAKPMGKIIRLAVLALAALFCYIGVAQAQWIFLGKKAVGAINRLTSKAFEKQGQGYDAATVLLEANAERVYATALDILKRNPSITINRADQSTRELEFTDDKILVGLKVSRFESVRSTFGNTVPASKRVKAVFSSAFNKTTLKYPMAASRHAKTWV